MPYDIYGNSLQRGYCEVHPDIPEEYPCSRCMERYSPDREPEPCPPEPCPPEPCPPEPTISEYIGFDAEKFKAVSEEVINSKEDDTAFIEAVKKLISTVDPGFINHCIELLSKEDKNANSVDNS
jgi:hypothetical protein